jgi:hypothetical protein
MLTISNARAFRTFQQALPTYYVGHQPILLTKRSFVMMTRKSLRDRIESHASDVAVMRALPLAIAIMLIVYGNYAIMKPTNSKFPPHVDFVQEPDNVTVARTLPPPVEYPVARGSALDFYLDGTWQAGTVTSVQEQSRTFAGILANGTIVHGMAHDDFKTTWRLPCMGNKPGDKSLARTRLPDGPKTSPVPQLTDQFLDRFIVVPEYKLLFCYVEKVRAVSCRRRLAVKNTLTCLTYRRDRLVVRCSIYYSGI